MTDQVPSTPAPGEDWYADDPALAAILCAHLGDAALKDAEVRLHALGRDAPARLDAWSREADRKRPRLAGDHPEDVAYDASYLALRAAAREHEAFTLTWRGASRPLQMALAYLYGQAEAGYSCPGCMTDGAAHVLARHASVELRDALVPRLVQRDVEGAFEGAMYLTEKDGGSDVGGGTQTRARLQPDGTWRLDGAKWFCSNVTAEVALALARMPDGAQGTEGLGLFVLRKRLPDGRPNPGLKLTKLKDKLGVASMPSGELTLEGAVADLVAPAPHGFRAMAEMVNLSRLYNAVISVAVARRALREGARAARTRAAFGKKLGEHPLFVRSLVDVALDVEAALAATLDVATVFERAQGAWHGVPKARSATSGAPPEHARSERGTSEDDAKRDDAKLLRTLTPPLKARTAKLAVRAASEGCEWIGGNGYIEDYVTPRLLRDAQVLPIWEGTTNVQALEAMKAFARDDGTWARHLQQLQAVGANAKLLPVVEAAGRAANVVRAEGKRLAAAPEAEREAAALRLLGLAYDAHAASALVHAAGASSSERLVEVARLFAAVRLADSRDAGERALERAVVSGAAGRVLGFA